jgi:predicted NBD/HSP70 family sugar kinase
VHAGQADRAALENAVNAVTEEPLSLRDEGRYRVLQALHDHGPCRRSDLARLTSLSRATIAALVGELVASGIVEEDPESSAVDGPRGMGRPASLAAIRPDAGYAVGVDVGHEHVRVAVCDLRGSPVDESLERRQVDLAPYETLDLAAQRIKRALTRRAIPASAVLGVGLAVPAPVQTVSGIVEAAGIMPGWVGVKPADELSARCGLPVRVIHGGDAGALAERTYGAARGADNLIYVRLTSGIGAGIMVGGRPLPEATGLSSELGHIQAIEDGPICRCGNRGCLETVASPMAIARLLGDSWHRPVTGPQLLELLDAGDRGAGRAVADAGRHIGKVLAAAVNLLSPELIVIGGDLSQAGDLLLDPIRGAIQRSALPAGAARVTVTCGQLRERAEALGAAAVILDEYPRRLALQGTALIHDPGRVIGAPEDPS